MPQLQDLPPELVVMICRHVGSAAGLVGLSATSRSLYAIASAEMYVFDAQKDRDCGPSALHWAAYKNDLAMARKALEAGANPDQYWFSGKPRVHVDQMMASAAAAREMDIAGPFRWAALHLAVVRGNPQMVQLLLDFHATVDVDSSGFCSCLVTTFTRDVSLSERCTQPSVEQWPLLHTAFCFGRDDIAKILVMNGAVLYNCPTISPFLPDTKTLRPRAMAPSATFASVMAAFYGCPKTLQYIIENHPGLNINQHVTCRCTILCHALFGEVPEAVVPLLINAGADVNHQTAHGRAVLYEACWGGRFAAALCLLNHGADIDCANAVPFVTLLSACCRRATHAALSTEFQAHYSGAFWFCRTLHHDPLKPPTSWPKCQVDKNAKARYEIVRTLLERGVDTEARTGLYGNPTALYLAAECHLHDIVELLLRHGADVSAKNAFGNTALMAAIASGFAETPLKTIKCLLQNGADVDAQNSDGDTALHLLQRSRFPAGEIAWLLLQNGANPQLCNKTGDLAMKDLPLTSPHHHTKLEILSII